MRCTKKAVTAASRVLGVKPTPKNRCTKKGKGGTPQSVKTTPKNRCTKNYVPYFTTKADVKPTPKK
jgi:hypothetical protein